MMRTGDIIFAYPTNILGQTIAKITKSRFSHVAMYIGNGYVIESDAFIKTRVIRLDQTSYGKTNSYEVMTANNLSDSQRIMIKGYAASKLGTSYDYTQILGIFIRLITGIKTNLLDKAHRYICTELIYESYQANGIELLEGHPGGSVSPEELRWSEHLQFYKEETNYAT